MDKKSYIVDCETDALTGYTKLWNVVFRRVPSEHEERGETNEVTVFRNVHNDPEPCRSFVQSSVGHWIGHNFIGFDRGVIQYFLGIDIEPTSITDTLVISRMLNYNQPGGHSLEAWGRHFGITKSEFNDFSQWSQELEDRCVSDTLINLKLYQKFKLYIDSPRWGAAFRLEHLTTEITSLIYTLGITFDLPKANILINTLTKLTEATRDSLDVSFPPRSKEIRTIVPVLTKQGTLHSKDFRWLEDKDLRPFTADAPFSLFDFVSFNPMSSTQRVERLNEAGWKPVNKTKGHLEAIRNKDVKKLEHYKIYGYKTDEENLSTLPETEDLELWRDRWVLKLKPSLTSSSNSGSKKKTETSTDTTLLPTHLSTLHGKKVIETDFLDHSTELIVKMLTRCGVSKEDVARFVESTKDSWLITVIAQDMYVDCSAPTVICALDGMKYTETLSKTISSITGGRRLAEFLLLESRLGDLKEWVGLCAGSPVDSRGYCRVHGTLTNPGAWTMRVSHQRPNMANIPAVLNRKGLPALYGKELRELWTVPEGYKLVGVDADSIQLRIFAHLCEDEKLIAAISRGRKEDKSDIHNVNKDIIGDDCKSREVAKTYIYALLLGAGLAKQASVLDCTKHEASQALKRILDYYPGWKRLISGRLSQEGERGYIECLDGRYLPLPEPRLALAGHLQSGEKIIMSQAMQNWIRQFQEAEKWFDEIRNNYNLVNWVHDEWQTEVKDLGLKGHDGFLPEYIARGQVQGIVQAGRDFKMNIELAGNYKVGLTWADTH